MAKTKKISINAFDKIIENTYTPTETVEWNGIEITIKNTLSLTEMMAFVDSVTKSCFTSDNGTYLPEVKDFAIKSCVLEMYANFAMPSNIEHRYKLIYCSDAISTVLQHINNQQFSEITQAIDDKVSHIAQANIEMVNRQANDLYASFDNLQKQLAEVFSGVGSDDMSKLVGAISKGKLNEEKLVQAYMSQTKPKKIQLEEAKDRDS